MKTIIFLMFVYCASITYAQNVEGDSIRYNKAFLFNFSGWNLGGGLGEKFVLKETMQLRISLSGSYSYSRYDQSSVLNRTTSSLTIGTDLIFPFYKFQTINPYYGFGLGCSTMRELTHYSDLTSGSNYSTGPQITLFVGFEYHITKQISLSGEQKIYLSYLIEPNYRQWLLGNSTSSLILSVYY